MNIHGTSALLAVSFASSFAWAGDAVEAQAAPFAYVEISPRKVVDMGDHTATFVRVRRPSLPKAPPPPAPRALTPEEQARVSELERKAYAVLSVTATVYLGGEHAVTELRWRDETGALSYRAYSNADFRYLTQLSHVETETTVYSWFPFVDTYDLSEWTSDQKHPLPKGLVFSATDIEYQMDSRALPLADQEATLSGLDYLHAFYKINYQELKAAYEKRMAENAAREEELRLNPPKTPDAILRWWPRTEKSPNR